MTELNKLSVAKLQEKLESKEVSAVEVAQAHLDQIEKTDGEINAFLAVNDNALKEAQAIDEARAKGEELGALAGIPIAIKDVLVTKNMPTTAASKMLEGYLSPFDATTVNRARAAGAIALGKTNMDEFAMGATTETSAFGVTRNPWNKDNVPGGSGGGSAAAVAAFQAPLAFGSDTGGSIRQPAALTGTVGMKPSYGAISRYGSIALSSSLDTVGPVGRSVADTAALHDAIVGHDPHDGTSVKAEWASMSAAANAGKSGEGLKGLKVGLIKELDFSQATAGVKARFDDAVTWLTSQGAEVTEISIPSIAHAVHAYYVILGAEASSNLAKFDSVRFGLRITPEGARGVEDVMSATRGAGFGAEVKRRILLGINALSAGNYDTLFIGAQKARALVAQELKEAFAGIDVLATLTAPVTAWKLGTKSDDPIENYLKDSTTIPVNLAGIPAISVPAGLADEDGMPVGLQLVADWGQEALLYQTAAAVEQMVTERDGAAVWEQIPGFFGEGR